MSGEDPLILQTEALTKSFTVLFLRNGLAGALGAAAGWLWLPRWPAQRRAQRAA